MDRDIKEIMMEAEGSRTLFSSYSSAKKQSQMLQMLLIGYVIFTS
jgi:hypothetical protein